jgi:hypothetical protein
MYGETRKLHLIEKILRIEDEAVLAEVESLLNGKLQVVRPGNFAGFAGIWTEEEADEMKRIIKDSCEQTNPDDWK